MLTYDDIELLLDALDKLEGESARKLLMDGMLGVLLSKDRDQAEDRLAEAKAEYDQSQAEARLLKNRVTLVKAKLIQMQDCAVADELDSALRFGSERRSNE